MFLINYTTTTTTTTTYHSEADGNRDMHELNPLQSSSNFTKINSVVFYYMMSFSYVPLVVYF